MTNRAKLLKTVAKHATEGTTHSSEKNADSPASSVLLEQYRIIREDIIKLADDITRGYDVAREMFDKKTLMKDLLKLK
jgi:hypothetical protein